MVCIEHSLQHAAAFGRHLAPRDVLRQAHPGPRVRTEHLARMRGDLRFNGTTNDGPDELHLVGPQCQRHRELGHLFTVLTVLDLRRIGRPLFGLVLGDEMGEHELRCRELAAMSVFQRLLRGAGREDLASEEYDETDSDTLSCMTEILRRCRCLRLPCSIHYSVTSDSSSSVAPARKPIARP